MLDFKITQDANGKKYLQTPISGKALLTISQLNKGTAFSEAERTQFDLTGKLPNKIETLEQQVKRAYIQYKSFDEEINRNVYLNNLLNNNLILFYQLVKEHLKEMIPTIYTPIVGNAVKVFNKKFSHPRGLYISFTDQDRIEEILDNRSNPNIKLIVVSDGEGVLGIGDQGVGAMAIPIAKLMVYTAFAGIDPLNTLPIMLDAGTNNKELLDDPLYLGWQHPRVSGKDYSQFIEKFVSAIQKKFPHAFLHWEDFGRTNAYSNLIKYREKFCSFNDDIQGTGVVATAAVLSALKHTNSSFEKQRIVIFGAGTAGMGITENIYRAMLRYDITPEQAKQKIWLIDRPGLLSEYVSEITEAQKPFIRTKAEIDSWPITNKDNISLLEVIKQVKPTILIGCSAMSGAFSEAAVTEMAKHVSRPVIFPLSNPTEKSEATPADIMRWTKNQAYIATGSPFKDIKIGGENIPVSQCNNYLSFPGIGLGVIAAQAKLLTDEMLWAASKALGTLQEDHPYCLLPTIDQAQATSRAIAIAVAKTAIEQDLAQATLDRPVEELIDENIWTPHYLPYQRVR